MDSNHHSRSHWFTASLPHRWMRTHEAPSSATNDKPSRTRMSGLSLFTTAQVNLRLCLPRGASSPDRWAAGAIPRLAGCTCAVAFQHPLVRARAAPGVVRALVRTRCVWPSPDESRPGLQAGALCRKHMVRGQACGADVAARAPALKVHVKPRALPFAGASHACMFPAGNARARGSLRSANFTRSGAAGHGSDRHMHTA